MNQNLILFLAGQAITLLLGLIAIYVRVTLKLKELEIRVQAVERQDDKIVEKLDNVMDKIQEVLIELQNKQDKP